MGIEGGISVIGTTGIVEPMSNSALVETIRVEAKIRKAAGDRYLLVNLGNYSGSFVEDELGLSLDRSVQCSNFIGDAVDIASDGMDITKLPEFKEADVIHLHWINQGFLSLKDIARIIKNKAKRGVYTPLFVV